MLDEAHLLRPTAVQCSMTMPAVSLTVCDDFEGLYVHVGPFSPKWLLRTGT